VVFFKTLELSVVKYPKLGLGFLDQMRSQFENSPHEGNKTKSKKKRDQISLSHLTWSSGEFDPQFWIWLTWVALYSSLNQSCLVKIRSCQSSELIPSYQVSGNSTQLYSLTLWRH